MVEYVKLWKQGGSLLVTIPPAVRDALGLAHGDRVALSVVNGQMVLTRIEPGKDEARFLPRRPAR